MTAVKHKLLSLVGMRSLLSHPIYMKPERHLMTTVIHYRLGS